MALKDACKYEVNMIKSDGVIRKDSKCQAKGKDHTEEKECNKHQMMYGVTDKLPFHILITLSLQQTITAIPGTVSIVYILFSKVCGEGDNLFFAELISTAIVMCGISTFLQVFFGIRLPIIQGGSHSYIPPIIALMSLPKWRCPAVQGFHNQSLMNSSEHNLNVTKPEDLWRPRMNEISGALILVSLVHISLGAFGVMGFLIRYIGPLTIAPTVSLIGISIIPAVSKAAEQHWGATILTAFSILLFSVYIGNVPLCCPSYHKDTGFKLRRLPIFRMIPVLLGIGIGWLFCFLLTVTGSLPRDPSQVGYLARTDARNDVFTRAKWIFMPYPGQFGTPTFSVGAFLGMICATLSSCIESIGVYHATSRICREPPPPSHAVNRGLAMEGFSSLISAVMGAGHATTSYSGTIGFIGVTKVGSRVVWYCAALLLFLLGLFGKFGAFMSTIPDPVVAGFMCVAMGMVIAVGIGNLRNVDLEASRNLAVLGVSMLMGIMVPNWIKDNPTAINTGAKLCDQLLTIILTTPMFVGGVLGFILDNTVPGTREERGFYDNASDEDITDNTEKNRQFTLYNLPFAGHSLDRFSCLHYLPMSPTFSPEQCSCRGKRKVDLAQEQAIDMVVHTMAYNKNQLSNS